MYVYTHACTGLCGSMCRSNPISLLSCRWHECSQIFTKFVVSCLARLMVPNFLLVGAVPNAFSRLNIAAILICLSIRPSSQLPPRNHHIARSLRGWRDVLLLSHLCQRNDGPARFLLAEICWRRSLRQHEIQVEARKTFARLRTNWKDGCFGKQSTNVRNTLL